jgi:predicted ATP-binding protein involved in virulence
LKYYNEIYEICAKRAIQKSNSIKQPFSVDIEKYSKLIEDIKQKEDFYINTYMMAFPSFFKVTIKPEKKVENSKISDETPIDTFSSGEKQRINGLSSIVYHIINLNSVEEYQDNTEFIRYKYINIILDEIELYYHPEWQRTFISDLLEYLSKINPSNLSNIDGINIILVTHSPFILSDIPNNNIIRLEKGRIKKYKSDEQTFGANIHDLLANSFFMPNGFMGNFAKNKIQSAIKWLEENNLNSEEWNKDTMFKFINLIGEPLIRNSLRDLYLEKFPDAIDKEIKRLQNLKKTRK